MINRFIKNALLRDIMKIVSGTAGGRAILLITLPIVTRLYSPEDFKLLAVFAALVSTTSVIACLRMEVAVPFSDNDDDAANILAIALTSTVSFALGLLALSLLAPMTIAGWISTPDIAPYLWLVPLAVLLAGSYASLQSWVIRKRRFGIIARTRVGQAIIGAGTMLGLGWFAFAPLGLLLGNTLTLGAGVVSLCAQSLRNDHTVIRNINLRRMHEMLVRNRRYPIFSTPEALANVAAIQFPILIIAATAGSEAGQLFLAMQVMTVPMTLIGASVGQVYSSRAAEELRNGTLHGFTKMIMIKLFLVGLAPMLLAAILAPFIVPIIFGAEWQRAGVLIAWISPWMLFQLVASPVSLVMALLERQQHMLILTLFGALLRISAVLFAIMGRINWVVEAYAISGCIFYIICALLFFWASKSKSAKL